MISTCLAARWLLVIRVFQQPFTGSSFFAGANPCACPLTVVYPCIILFKEGGAKGNPERMNPEPMNGYVFYK
ncbi:MAG: hypothetical protein B1H11_11470 [Desulfobacteraceae bacterium 4484_190.1]|nr:MAG: hypothetical protein B1H11_11470 [Desulfobacteraceae bacterium 4484_190.1]